MTFLTHIPWKTKYSPEAGNLLDIFYIPALSCAVRYDRSTGYFKASALAAAAKGVEGLIANRGRMRLIVGCTLDPEEAQAIAKGESLRDRVEARLLRMPLIPADSRTGDALELLAWMVANGRLDVKIAVPCDASRRPVSSLAIFHEKAGIIEDPRGNRIAFNGSINESESGWTGNFDSFHVFTAWGPAAAHLDAEEESFSRLWADRALTAIVMDVPEAVRAELLKFLPENGALPKRMEVKETGKRWEKPPEPETEGSRTPAPFNDPRKTVWAFIHKAPALPDGGERIGEATCGITPWPHQVRAFARMYDNWPPRLLIADEVGLGKTIQAGMVLRQAFLAKRAKRMLILAPKAVLIQWQIELREKFNLNWPIYDGKRFNWYPSRAREGNTVRAVEREAWHTEPCVIASSHLMRRRDRARELLEDADPWDLVVLDEAHHARRRGGGAGSSDHRPNQLLRLMQGLRNRTRGLLLLTATPMQVSPIEVWDLLSLLGLPPEWHSEAFVRFFDDAAAPMPGNPELDFMARLFRSVEAAYGEVSEPSARQLIPELKKLKVRKVLRALRDEANIPRRQLETAERRAAVKLMKANTPIKRLISRHTRELLRRYFKAGKLSARIAQRAVSDRFVAMTEAERTLYEAVEEYISGTYNNAAPEKKTAIGFVMTIYRRRLASSFYALSRTLENRLCAVAGQCGPLSQEVFEEDLPEDELTAEIMDAEEAAEMEAQTLALEEKDALEILLAKTRQLPTDTKTETLLSAIRALQAEGYPQVMVFTQYTDTLDFLRTRAARTFGPDAVICFSGRGGEVPEAGGKWRRITREETKARFKAGSAEILLCTDAAAEGLNFQFCGALVNYDMPWNPMKVEQRIGRIDRLGQAFPTIRIINLHYEDTVETDVYTALQERISLFTSFVGKLQPILAKLPRAIADVTLEKPGEKERARAALISGITAEADQLDTTGFDLDEAIDEELIEPEVPDPLYGLPELNRILASENLLPPGIEVKKLGEKDFTYLAPGMKSPLRVTTDPEYFDAHPESTELWSPGGELFPTSEAEPEGTEADAAAFYRILAQE